MIFKEIMSFNFKAKFKSHKHKSSGFFSTTNISEINEDNNTKKSFVDQKNEFKSLNYETLLMSLPLKGKYPNEG